MTLRADPTILLQGGTVVEAAGQQGADAASTLRDGCRTASGASGSPRVAAALDRFAAAWGGELLSWGLSVNELSRIAVENGRQVAQVNGFSPFDPFGLSPHPLDPLRPSSPFPVGPTMPTMPGTP